MRNIEEKKVGVAGFEPLLKTTHQILFPNYFLFHTTIIIDVK